MVDLKSLVHATTRQRSIRQNICANKDSEIFSPSWPWIGTIMIGLLWLYARAKPHQTMSGGLCVLLSQYFSFTKQTLQMNETFWAEASFGCLMPRVSELSMEYRLIPNSSGNHLFYHVHAPHQKLILRQDSPPTFDVCGSQTLATSEKPPTAFTQISKQWTTVSGRIGDESRQRNNKRKGLKGTPRRLSASPSVHSVKCGILWDYRLSRSNHQQVLPKPVRSNHTSLCFTIIAWCRNQIRLERNWPGTRDHPLDVDHRVLANPQSKKWTG